MFASAYQKFPLLKHHLSDFSRELAASSNSNSVTNQWVILGKVLHLFLSQSLSSKSEGISVHKLLMWPRWECKFCFHCCYSIEVVSETGNIFC